MDTFDKLRLIKLSKNNCQILLDSNDGFIINTTYNSNKGGAYKREYKIFNGKLHIHKRKNTDSSHDNTFYGRYLLMVSSPCNLLLDYPSSLQQF